MLSELGRLSSALAPAPSPRSGSRGSATRTPAGRSSTAASSSAARMRPVGRLGGGPGGASAALASAWHPRPTVSARRRLRRRSVPAEDDDGKREPGSAFPRRSGLLTSGTKRPGTAPASVPPSSPPRSQPSRAWPSVRRGSFRPQQHERASVRSCRRLNGKVDSCPTTALRRHAGRPPPPVNGAPG
jgi:hypothetical protein